MQGNLPKNAVHLFRCFLAIADNPNINQTADTLNISRQTLKRLLKELEQLCGFELLEFGGYNQYKLTTRAENWIQDVRVWLQQGEDLLALSNERAAGLINSIPRPGTEPFFSQQHPMTSLWEHNTPYLQSMFKAWIKAEAKFDSPAFSKVSENAFLARMRDGEFVIMGIGKKAAIMNWLGRDWCLSAIGKPLSSTAISTKADRIVTYAYRQVIMLGSPWYDHVSMEMPRPVIGTQERAYYRRLILPCKLPDGSPVVASIVELSDELEIGDFEVPQSNQTGRKK